MVKQRDDVLTLDLLTEWQPPEPVKRFDEERVRALSLKDRLSHAVAETLKDCGKGRDEIAAEMSKWLGETVAKSTLDGWAAESKVDACIPFIKLIALCKVTGDHRLLQMAGDPLGLVVVEEKFQPWIEVGIVAARRDQVEKANKATEEDFKFLLRRAKQMSGGGS